MFSGIELASELLNCSILGKAISRLLHGDNDMRYDHNELGTQPSSGGQTETSQKVFGPVDYYANARHNQADKWFRFTYRKVRGDWLTYIERMPNLNGRSGDLHRTHRYRNGNTYWICYDPQPRTLEEAKSVSRAWADRELEYIATGVPFERQNW